MKAVLRVVVAVFAGLIAGFIVVVAMEMFGNVVHPVPEGFGGTQEEMCEHVRRFPPWVLAVAVPAWAFAAFVSTWVAQRIGSIFSSAFVGLLLLAALAFN